MTAYYELPYQSRTWYYGNGSQKDFLVTFAGGAPLDPSHVKVAIQGTELTTGWSIVVVGGQQYVRFVDAPGGVTEGEAPNIMLRRETPSSASKRVVDFTDGSILSANDLDRAQLNSLYVSQESADIFLDQGGSAVNLNFPQTIIGAKTFETDLIVSQNGGLRFEVNTPLVKVANGKQYVLAAQDVDGFVQWQPTTVDATDLPQSVVRADFPTASAQIITAPKRFEGKVAVLNGNLQIEGQNAAGKAVVATDNTGNTELRPIVNGVRLGSSNAAVSTGVVTISPESIGALSANTQGGQTQTVTVPVNFTSSIGLGDDASADILTINSSLVVPPNAAAGKVLTCLSSSGNAAWAEAPQTGITSVNGKTGSTSGGSISLTASDVGAVSVDTTQNINGAKTFTNDVNLGVDAFDRITIAGDLYIPSTGTFGQVLTRTEAGKAIWQTPEPAGVSKVNGASGEVTITAASLNAYTPQTIPTATTDQKGLMQVGSGLTVNNGVVSVSQNAQLPVASATTLGGIKVGSNLSINPETGVLSAGITGTSGVTTFNSRSGDVSPASGDYTAAQVTNAATTNSAQDITASKKFTANQSVTAATPAVGTNGSSGVLLNTSGLIQAQRSSANDRIFQGHAPAGGVTSYIESDGTAWFDGLVTAQSGFFSPGGMTIGDNTSDGINITGTLKITGNGSPAAGKVLTCTNASGNVEWQTPSNAPVTNVNNLTGNVKISLDGEANPSGNLGGVTKGTAQDITGTKTFTVAQNFHGDVKLGDAVTDTVTLNAKMLVPADKGANKVLTCIDAATGQMGWAPPRVNSVRGSQVAIGNAQIGDVSISAADVGAATTAELATVSAAATAAQTSANSASTAASNALSTAQSKLSAVTTTTTPVGPVGQETNLVCLSGNGTAASPLRVEGAPPIGQSGGDLAGSYPNPTIGANKVTYAKFQMVGPQKVLGGPTTGTSTGQVREIGLGAGLGFDASGNLANTSINTVEAGSANTFTQTNTFQAATTFSGAVTASANVTLGSDNSDTTTILSNLKFTGSSPVNGYFLKCDANGNASWAATPSSTFTPTVGMVGSSVVLVGTQEAVTNYGRRTVLSNQTGSLGFVRNGDAGAANQINVKGPTGQTWAGVCIWKDPSNLPMIQFVTVTSTGTATAAVNGSSNSSWTMTLVRTA